MKTNIFTSIFVVLAIAIFCFPAWGTDVGGIIDTDTVWNLAGSPYNITDTVQIAEGVTLTIEPGVIVNSDSNDPIEVWGSLSAVGADSLRIFLNSITLANKSPTASILIQFAEINSGQLTKTGSNSPGLYGTWMFLDSKFSNVTSPIYLCYPSADCYVERNVFINCMGIDVIQNSNVKVYIRNNIFYQQPEDYDPCIETFNSHDVSETLVHFNSFLSINNAVEVIRNGKINATNNYWGTLETTVINSMIHDRNDDLLAENYIEYMPFLTEPHPNTPIFDFNQAPTAVFGPDQVVFDEVILDGRDSYDPDGLIDLYEWKLEYIGDPAHDKTAIGENPTIINLYPGSYNAYLTVTDNNGAKGMDYALVSAAGPCPISPIHDQDEDGEPDITDFCANTLPETDVDSNGCSLSQFCSAIDTNMNHGRQICNRSDWKNDEPLKSRGDCKVVRQGKGPSNYSCVPR